MPAALAKQCQRRDAIKCRTGVGGPIVSLMDENAGTKASRVFEIIVGVARAG